MRGDLVLDTGQPFYSNVTHGHFALSSSQNQHSHEKIGVHPNQGDMGYQNWRSKYGHIIQNTPSLLDGKRRRGTLKEKISAFEMLLHHLQSSKEFRTL